MSRLIVKNLPQSITDAKLKATFAAHGVVTDLQLKYNKQGKFRGFGFVGFKEPEEATKAKEWLDGTFIGAVKIKVEFCKDLGTGEGVQNNNETKSKKEVKKSRDSVLDKYKDDVKFQEFARAVGKESEVLTVGTKVASVEDEDETEQVEATKELSDLDYLKSKTVVKEKKSVELLTVKLSGLPYKCKKRDVKQFFGASLKPASIRLPPKIKGIGFAGFKTEKEHKQALTKNKSFIGQSQVQVVKYVVKGKEGQEAGQGAAKEGRWAVQEAALEGVETIGESGRIFVRNLSYAVTEEDIETLFSKFGPLTETSLPIDRLTRKQKGFAFVTFMMPEHAVAAFTALDGSSFQGRLLHLIPAKAKVEHEDEEEDGGEGNNYKKKKEAKQKATAGSSHNWNSLFLGGSAVADVLAEQYGVDKAAVVLGGEKGGNTAAVKLALGETQVVAEVRAFLEEQGVLLDAFSRPAVARSKTVILIKNLPAKTSPEELRDMFSAHGVLARLVLPPHGLSALVEFCEAAEARTAFTRLAYTKFHNTPLYLEWAPHDTFCKPAAQLKEVEEKSDTEKSDVVAKEIKKEESKGDTEDTQGHEDGATLFIKNLNFITTEKDIEEHFKACGKIFSVSVATKKNPKTKETLSMGFGFITFYQKASAEKALKSMQHSRLADHCLELKRSTRAGQSHQKQDGDSRDKSTAAAGKPSTKLLVRNIPFQATKEEIAKLFKTFGDLAAVRLPRKMAGTGDHRGFAFVEFNSITHAKAAFSSLVHSTHLYGRRLVLEWASGESSLEEMRNKTRQQWAGGTDQGAKRHKFDVNATPADMGE